MTERDINVLLFNSIRTREQRCIACGRAKKIEALTTCKTCHSMFCDFCMNNSTTCFDCAHPVATLENDPAFQALLLEQQRIIIENEPPLQYTCASCTKVVDDTLMRECRACEAFYCPDCMANNRICGQCSAKAINRLRGKQ